MQQILSEHTKLLIKNGLHDDGNAYQEVINALERENPSGAMDYFVDGNVKTSGDGKSWDTAFKTLSEAITASNISIALSSNRWWARRNRIFALGDQELNEDLTILPEKCDVIGCGTDLFPFPRMIGNHTIAATRPTAGKATGCRFINMGFIDKTGTGDVFAIPAGCYGISFIGCTFLAKGGGSAGKALEITDCGLVRIIDCKILLGNGIMANIFATGISLEGTTFADFLIENCHITATVGIAVADAVVFGSLIRNNVIRATSFCIDENSNDVQIVGNMMISDATDDGTGTGGAALAVDCNVALAVGNRLTCGDPHLNAPYPIEGTLS